MPYDAARADRVVSFFKELRHTKGEFAGRPFILEPWQEHDIIRPLFGTVRDDGLRQYRTAYISTARKNGKSEIAAGCALYLTFADNEPGAEVYGAAYTREQASQVFNVAADMVESNFALRYWGQVRRTGKIIHVPVTGSFYKAIPGEVRGTWGFNPHAVVFDELHAQKTRDFWDALTTGSGSRLQPLIIAITTAGNDRESLCYQLYEYAKRVRAGEIDDPTFFVYIAEADPQDDWRDPGIWHKANPALGTFNYGEELKTKYKEALSMPSQESAFRQLYLNQWTDAVTVWLPKHVWMEQRKPVAWKRLRGESCFGGLDLASSTDLAAFVLVFPPEKKHQGWTVLPHFWLPEKALETRSRRDRVNYRQWVKDGYITATPGEVIDYRIIRQHLEKVGAMYQVEEVAFDRWGAVQLSTELSDDGLTMVPMGQGFASMSGPAKDFETLYMQRQFAHDGNPVMNWQIGNVTVERDGFGNVKPSKRASTARIDGVVALIMALSRGVLYQPSVYEREGILKL